MLQGRYICGDCCEPELWHAPSRNLPTCDDCEDDLVTASLKSKKTFQVTSYEPAIGHLTATSALLQLKSSKNEQEKAVVTSDFHLQNYDLSTQV